MELPTPAGYRGLRPLDREQHRGLGVAGAGRYPFAARLNVIYVTVLEYFRAARHYPIAFARDEVRNEASSVVVTGLVPRQNLFCTADGHWREGVYVPAYVRRYPFFTVGVSGDDGGPDALVCVDEAGLEPSPTPLFDAAGNASAEWQTTETLINDMESAHRLTRNLCRHLDELELMEPFDVQAFPRDGQSRRLRGLSRVNETRLNALGAGDVKELMAAGELSRIYAHLMSLDNFAGLLDLAGTGKAATVGD